MAQQAATSGNERKARITVLHAGNVSNNAVKNIAQADTVKLPLKPDNKTIFLANGNSASNIGASGAFSSRQFNSTRENQYIMPYMTSKIAGTSDNTLRSPASDFGQTGINKFAGYERYHNVSWDAATGDLTKGANAGVTVQPSGVDNVVGPNTDHAIGTDAIPGELVYMITGRVPTQEDYNPRNG